MAEDDQRGMKPVDVIQGLGGFAVLMLGALYGVGALLTMADLHGAGVDVRDALPLIPLEDLLARGIGTTVFSGLALLGILVFVFAYDGSYRAQRDTAAEDILMAVAVLVLLAAILIALVVLPFPLGSGILAGVVLLILVENHISPRQTLACAMVPILVGVALYAYFAPQPLAQAELLETGGDGAVGALVTVDDRWYLATGGDKILAVESDRVQSVRLDSQSREKLQDSLTDAFGIPAALVAAPIAVLGILGVVATLVLIVRRARRLALDDEDDVATLRE